MSLSSLYLDAFYACAQTGHFTRATRHLHITQSALSQRVANLEEDLGTAVFIRDRAGLRLTPAGERLLQYCRTKEALEKESLEQISSPKASSLSGHIRIGGFSSIMRSIVLPTLSPLLQKNPKIHLTFLSKEMDELPNLLRRGEIDYLLVYQELIRDGLETSFLGMEENVRVEKRGYTGPDVYLDHDENDQTTLKYFRLKREKKNFQRRYLDEVYGLIDGVRLGIGRAIIPRHLIKDMRELRILDKKTVLKIPVYLHYHRQPFYTKLHTQVVNHLRKGFERLR